LEISALTRTVVKHNHAVICPDGYVNSNIPGWTDCMVNVIINEAMGAGFCQNLVTLSKNGKLEGETFTSQIFFYVISGKCTAKIDWGEPKTLVGGQFVYVPVLKDYVFDNADEGTKILTFHSPYEQIKGHNNSEIIFGDTSQVTGKAFMGDEALQLQILLPEDFQFDMAVNIFTFEPGGHLPFVETHVMEHGLLFLQGQGIYLLDEQWHPVKEGDSIWMAPYCRQWFTAMGKQPAKYIYYKNVNRFPTAV
jgi:(S)-ureidoglycine aminohydrolase